MPGLTFLLILLFALISGGGVGYKVVKARGFIQHEATKSEPAATPSSTPSPTPSTPPNEPQKVPTPALLPGLLGLGASVFRKRQQEGASTQP